MTSKERQEWAWAAGFFEGNGTFAPVTVKGMQYPRASVSSTDKWVVDKFLRIAVVGYLTLEPRQGKDLYRWVVSQRDDLESFYARVGPLLSPRRQQTYLTMMALAPPRKRVQSRRR